MQRASVGEEEMEVLRWVSERAPVSVGEVAEEFGRRRGLARTTVVTMLERLRRKGFLEREKVGGVFRYGPSEPHAMQLRDLVRRFMNRSLGGSLAPFAAYLAEDAAPSPEELEQLKEAVRELEARSQESQGQESQGQESQGQESQDQAPQPGVGGAR